MTVAVKELEEKQKRAAELRLIGKKREDREPILPLSFPYDDLYELYAYAMRKLGLTNPF